MSGLARTPSPAAAEAPSSIEVSPFEPFGGAAVRLEIDAWTDTDDLDSLGSLLVGQEPEHDAVARRTYRGRLVEVHLPTIAEIADP